MSTLAIYDIKGTEVGQYDLPDDVLELEKGAQAVHDVVVARQAARRAGTASTLQKGEVAGSGKKPWKQKGTGRARAGYRQSPVWRGGSVAFGPRPRSYAVKVNRKVAQLAFRRALSEKISAGEIRILDSVSLDEPKTKLFAGLMSSLNVAAPALFVLSEVDDTLALASRNISRVEVVRAKDVSVYQLLRYPTIIVDNAGMDQLKTRMGGKA